MKKIKFSIFISIAALFTASAVYAKIAVPMFLTNDEGQKEKSIGTVYLEKSTCGILITPHLHGLPPGIHGFHIHEMPACGNKGMAAGGHFDPKHIAEHRGPYHQHSHLGDLPVLIVGADGNADLPVLAPRLSLSQLAGHALMIHAGADNYSDQPQKLGGGGERIACGVIGR